MSAAEFASDIPVSIATAAYTGTSHSPDTRAANVIREYSASLQASYGVMAKAASAGGTTDLLQAEFDRFRAGYRKHFTAWLASRSRCISAFIAGPSNFPTRRAEKRNDVADRRLGDLIDFERRARASACRTLRPDLRPIMAGDGDAIERLESEIATAERVQARMKLANLAIRKHAKMGSTDQIAALIDMGYSDARAQQLIKPDSCGRVGFPDYALTNNSANIRRMKQRLAQISAAREQPATSKSANGVTMDDCPSDNRVRLTFPGKPSDAVRSTLKSNGFRWTPSLGVWQAYRNPRAMSVAQQMVSA